MDMEGMELCLPSISNRFLCLSAVPHLCNKMGRVLVMQIFTLRLQLLMRAFRCVISTHSDIRFSSPSHCCCISFLHNFF